MVEDKSLSRRLFLICNYIFMIAVALICVLPFIHVWAISLSSSVAVSMDAVQFWPVEATLDAYKHILNKPEFGRALVVSLNRLVLGTAIAMLMTMLIAYPLSKEPRAFRQRPIYLWYFIVPMLIGGGLIPTYMTIRNYGLLDTIWALVLPSAVPVYHAVLLLNFFRVLPKELEESSVMDGAGHWTILFRIFLPLSLPALATITLFTMVGHWNSWFDGLIYMNRNENYPLQSYLQTIVVRPDVAQMVDVRQLADITERTVKTAQIFLGTLPILIVYPFLQRFFIKGIVLGSVKG